MGVSCQRHASAALCPGERTPGTHCTWGWVGPRVGLDTEDRGHILCPCRGSNPDRPVIQPVVRHYTAWANPAPLIRLDICKPTNNELHLVNRWNYEIFSLDLYLIHATSLHGYESESLLNSADFTDTLDYLLIFECSTFFLFMSLLPAKSSWYACRVNLFVCIYTVSPRFKRLIGSEGSRASWKTA
jgi:hypothetical protein